MLHSFYPSRGPAGGPAHKLLGPAHPSPRGPSGKIAEAQGKGAEKTEVKLTNYEIK